MSFAYNVNGQLMNPAFAAAAAIGAGNRPDPSMDILNYNARLKEAAGQSLLDAQQLQLAHAQLLDRGQTGTRGNTLGSQNSELGPSIAQQMTQNRFDTTRQDQQARLQQQTADAAKKTAAAQAAADAKAKTAEGVRQENLRVNSLKEQLGLIHDKKAVLRKELEQAGGLDYLDLHGPELVAKMQAEGRPSPDVRERLSAYNQLTQQEDQLAHQIVPAPAAALPASPAGAPQGGQPRQVSSVEEAMALPSGTAFLTPDGRLKVRP